METETIVFSLERRLRANGFHDPLWIADTIRSLLDKNASPTLSNTMDSLDSFLESYWSHQLGLEISDFPDLKYEGIVLAKIQENDRQKDFSKKFKEQFSSRGKGFGKMVPRPIDFAGFAKLTEEKIDKKTLFFTSIFWFILYSIIIYFIL